MNVHLHHARIGRHAKLHEPVIAWRFIAFDNDLDFKLVSRDFNRFFGGVETSSDWTGARTQTDDSPVLFIFPGEAGFGSTTPQFDCDQLMTQIPQERAAS